jgi:prolipoprotein diacylglyceryltransferase
MTFAILLFGAAFLLRNRAPFPGVIFYSAVAAYGAGRFLLENLREDESNGRDKAAMQGTSIALMIAPSPD